MHNQHEQNRDPSDHLQILVLTPFGHPRTPHRIADV